MSRIVWLSLFALLATGANAQQRGGAGGSAGARVGHGAVPGGSRQSGFAPGVFGQGRFRGGFLNRANRGNSYGYGYGWFGDGVFPYVGDFDYGYPPPVDAQPFPPRPILFQPPPRPVQGVIHDYTSSGPAPAVPSPAEPAAFGIVLKDGSVRDAVAVVVDDEGLKYTEPDGRNVLLSIYAVDRAATRALNRQRNLNLWLPPTP